MRVTARTLRLSEHPGLRWVGPWRLWPQGWWGREFRSDEMHPLAERYAWAREQVPRG